MKKKNIIGLIGVKQSGKSTVCNIIKKYIPNAKESALADKLKNVCADVFGLKREQLDLQELKEVPFDKPKRLTSDSIVRVLIAFGIKYEDMDLGKIYKSVVNMDLLTPRHIAQIVGTEVLRQAGDKDVHCKNVDIDGDLIIISDVRFKNELDFFSDKNKFNFTPFYIHRKEAEKHVTENSHRSEKEVLEFCHKCVQIDNNSTIDDLEKQIKCCLQILTPSLQQ